MSPDLEHRVAALARRQHGVATRSQLLELGLRSGAVQRCASAGRFQRLHHGVYQLGPILPPRGRLLAAMLACGPVSLLADWSAADLWQLIHLPRRDRGLVYVVVVGGTARSRSGIRVRSVRRLDPGERGQVDGIP